MPHEAAWRAWFASAEGLVPLTAVQQRERIPNLTRCAKMLANSRGNPVARQYLFSAYVHTPPGSAPFGRMHTFYKRDLKVRSEVRSGCLRYTDLEALEPGQEWLRRPGGPKALSPEASV